LQIRDEISRGSPPRARRSTRSRLSVSTWCATVGAASAARTCSTRGLAAATSMPSREGWTRSL
jgi:hypothetical protein